MHRDLFARNEIRARHASLQFARHEGEKALRSPSIQKRSMLKVVVRRYVPVALRESSGTHNCPPYTSYPSLRPVPRYAKLRHRHAHRNKSNLTHASFPCSYIPNIASEISSFVLD